MHKPDGQTVRAHPETPMTTDADYFQTATLIVDADVATMAFDGDDLIERDTFRKAIDEIATRVEAECERRGIRATVEREYTTTGRGDEWRDVEPDPTIWDAVLIDGVDELRAAVFG